VRGADETMKKYLITKGLREGTDVKKVVCLDRCVPWFLLNKRWFPKTVSLRDQLEDLETYCVSV